MENRLLETPSEWNERDRFNNVVMGLEAMTEVFRDIERMRFPVKIWFHKSSEMIDQLKRSKAAYEAGQPLVLPERDLFFRVERRLWVLAKDAEEQLYLDFAEGIVALDDLRRIRRCGDVRAYGCGRFYIRKKVQRQDHYFCADQCRKNYHNNKER
jgi:hypothetical protein